MIRIGYAQDMYSIGYDLRCCLNCSLPRKSLESCDKCEVRMSASQRDQHSAWKHMTQTHSWAPGAFAHICPHGGATCLLAFPVLESSIPAIPVPSDRSAAPPPAGRYALHPHPAPWNARWQGKATWDLRELIGTVLGRC